MTGPTASEGGGARSSLLPLKGTFVLRGEPMSAIHGTPVRPRAARRTAAVAALIALATVVAGCTGSADAGTPAPRDGPSTSPSASASPESVARVSTSLPEGSDPVPVDQKVELTAKDGTFDRVEVTFGPQRAPAGRRAVRRQDHLDLHPASRARPALPRADRRRRRRGPRGAGPFLVPHGAPDARPADLPEHRAARRRDRRRRHAGDRHLRRAGHRPGRRSSGTWRSSPPRSRPAPGTG